jgi:hypothetical protein
VLPDGLIGLVARVKERLGVRGPDMGGRT